MSDHGLLVAASAAPRSAPAPAPAPPRAGRRPVLAGVALWLAGRFGLDPLVVRLAFLAATLAGGAGVLVYLIAALVMPADAVRALPGRRTRRAAVEVGMGAGLLALALLLTLRALHLWVSDAVTWPVVLVAAGGALIWRTSTSAPPAEVAEAQAAAAVPRGRAPAAPATAARVRAGWAAGAISRTSAGIALVLAAGVVFLGSVGALGAARDVALAALVVAVALGIILAPWFLRLARSRDAERAERIRSQERAEVAAHLHDSVLQTLALVQKRAGDPREVTTLARRQERELRSWLNGRPGSEAAPARLAAALEAAAADVEGDHGVAVELVVVGDRPLDAHGEALVAAAREAMVNAAKHAGGAVSVFAEVGAAGHPVSVFVRDRGPGFDPGAVPAGRRGVRESIVARLARHGGRAEVRSSAEEGTEWELRLP